jgi:hypothetical protein
VLRVAILLVFWIGLELLAKAVTVLQLLHVVWKKHPHRPMQRLGTMVGDYTNQLWRYCMHASNQAPWPFSPWPRGESAD